MLNFNFYLGTNGINWITEDCGNQVKAINSGTKIQEFNFHPTQKNWALAASWTVCEDFEDGEPCAIYKELFFTKDLGATW